MPIAVLLIIALCVAAVLLGAWSVSTTIESRQAVGRSSRAIAQYGTNTNVRQQEMLESIGERVLAPVGAGMLGLARRFTPVGYVDQLKHKIVLAGNPPGFEVDRFLVAKVFAVGMIIPWFLLVFLVLGLNGFLGFLFVAGLSALTFFGPDAVLSRRIDDRRREIERELPDVLDLLVISVEAGLGFEQALDRTTSSVPGALSEEARRMLQETRMGASRSDALRALDERTNVEDLRSFILAMLQADNFGISVAKILKSQADEMRLRRRQHAQERAQKAPIKMLFPLVFCIFPSIFTVLLVPALIKVADTL